MSNMSILELLRKNKKLDSFELLKEANKLDAIEINIFDKAEKNSIGTFDKLGRVTTLLMREEKQL